MLAGCGGSQPPIGVPGATTQTSALAAHADRGTRETVLYSFAGSNDGQYPAVAPILVGGEFYGTTALGGNGGCHAVMVAEPPIK
jgi:hypothetical protein